MDFPWSKGQIYMVAIFEIRLFHFEKVRQKVKIRWIFFKILWLSGGEISCLRTTFSTALSRSFSGAVCGRSEDLFLFSTTEDWSVMVYYDFLEEWWVFEGGFRNVLLWDGFVNFFWRNGNFSLVSDYKFFRNFFINFRLVLQVTTGGLLRVACEVTGSKHSVNYLKGAQKII